MEQQPPTKRLRQTLTLRCLIIIAFMFVAIACALQVFVFRTGSSNLVGIGEEEKPCFKGSGHQSLSSMWDEVTCLSDKQLPQSAKRVVNEKIIPAALKSHNEAQVMKAFFYLVRAEGNMNGMAASIAMLEAELKTPTYSFSEVGIAILHSVAGESYKSYMNSKRFEIAARTDLGEDGLYSSDMVTWPLAQLERVSFSHFAKSLSPGTKLAETSAQSYQAVFEEDYSTKESIALGYRIRPALLDVLGHQALSFMTEASSYLTEPSIRFTLIDTRAFDDVKKFVELSFTSDNKSSRKLAALKIFQQMLSMKLETITSSQSSDAVLSLVELDLLRINFVQNNIKLITKKEIANLQLKFYDDLIKRYGAKYPAATSSAYVAKGNLYQSLPLSAPPTDDVAAPNVDREIRYDLENALVNFRLAQKVGSETGNPEAWRDASLGIRNILMPILTVQIEESLPSNAPFLVSCRAKNVEKLSYRVYHANNSIEQAYQNERRAELLLSLPPADEQQTVDIKSTDNYGHTIEFVASGIKKPGKYAIVIWDDSSVPSPSSAMAAQIITISNLATIATTIGESSVTVVVDRTTGEPLEGVKATYYKTEWKINGLIKTKLGSGESDHNGFIIPHGEADLIILANGMDTLRCNQGRSYNYNSRPEMKPQTIFFLDRNIYRPTQIVHFKGLHVMAGVGAPTVLAGKEVNIRLVAGGQVKATQTIATNVYGTFEGSFIAPSSGPMGFMLIESDGSGSASFRVEEYKRPRFEVKLSVPAQNIKLGERGLVAGVATNFAGMPLLGATVRFRVRRSASIPWQWRFWGRSPSWSSTPAEVHSGETVADEQGTFQIVFDTVPDLDSQASDFNFEVAVDVVDITGESHSSVATMKVGTTSLVANVGLSDTMSLGEMKSVPIEFSDLNGNPLATTADITVEKVLCPYEPNRPFINRYWGAPERIVQDKKTFKKLLPHFAYTDELEPSTWPLSGEKHSYRIKSNGSSTTVDINKDTIQAGSFYRVTLEARDSRGSLVKIHRVIQCYDTAALPYPSSGTPSLRFTRDSFQVNQTAVVHFNAPIRFDGAAQAVLAVVSSATTAGQLGWSNMIAESPQGERSVVIQTGDQGWISAMCVYVAYNRVYTSTKQAPIPWADKQLSFEYLSFRNVLEPGQKEEWRLRVKSTADPSEGIAAEVVASLYDASLDTLKGNTEHTFGNPSYIFPQAAASVSANAGFGFWATFSYIDYERVMPQTSGQTFPGAHYPQLINVAPNQGQWGMPEMMMMKRSGSAAEGGRVAADTAQLLDVPEQQSGKTEPVTDTPAPMTRTNLQETAFFLPTLRTESDGTLVISFTMGDALTRWRLLAFAHTADLKIGTLNDGSIITQKTLMVTPNAPRFLREGDTMSFTAKVSALGNEPRAGIATLELIDGLTNEPRNALFGLPPVANIPFNCSGNGQSVSLSWPIEVPLGSPSLVTWRVVAKSGSIGDGEESTLPVVSNKMLVTESIPMTVRGGQNKTFTLRSLAGSTSTTLRSESLTVEFTSNPVWYAVQALPYLMDHPLECSEQLFSRFYANSLASYITRQLPVIQQVFATWREKGSDAMKSNLAKNEELKSAVLQETPWVMAAQSEEEQKRAIGLLWDLDRMAVESESAVNKLRERQESDGGFAWFPGGRGSWYITQHIAMGMAHLIHLGVSVPLDVFSRAQEFSYLNIVAEYDRLVDLASKGKIKFEDRHIGPIELLFLYTESFSVLHPTLQPKVPRRKEIMNYYQRQAARYWQSLGLYERGLAALTLHRIGRHDVPETIVRSLRELSHASEEMGTHWKSSNFGYHFYDAPIETQALLVEAFNEITEDNSFVDELRLWLLKNKQTNHWRTTKQTTEAIYALLVGGTNWLESTDLVTVSVGKNLMPVAGAEPGTGYVTHRYPAPEVTKEMATIAVSNPNRAVAWGAAYWQYLESLDKIKSFEETPLQIKKELKRVLVTEAGEVLKPLGDDKPLRIGDKVRVRIEIRVDRPMDFVHLKDMRASGLEPLNVLSSYKWQDGLGFYEVTKDLGTHFFFDHLPEGTFVLEYSLVASQVGSFSNGITTMQCMYAPEYTSHSEGSRVKITQK